MALSPADASIPTPDRLSRIELDQAVRNDAITNKRTTTIDSCPSIELVEGTSRVAQPNASQVAKLPILSIWQQTDESEIHIAKTHPVLTGNRLPAAPNVRIRHLQVAELAVAILTQLVEHLDQELGRSPEIAPTDAVDLLDSRFQSRF